MTHWDEIPRASAEIARAGRPDASAPPYVLALMPRDAFLPELPGGLVPVRLQDALETSERLPTLVRRDQKPPRQVAERRFP
jgi:hypothetical protein